MRVPSQAHAIRQVAAQLAELFDVPGAEAVVRKDPRAPEANAIVHVGSHTFVVDWKASGATAAVLRTIEQVQRSAARVGKRAIPLLVVPFMGDAGRERCHEVGVAWLDLSGNVRIVAPGLRILVEGRRNRFKQPGRPSSVFAPKSARIVRWLLVHPDRPMTQREIARATDMDEGFTSRIVGRLEADGFVVRRAGGKIQPRDPDMLLDAWREAYDFSRHRIVRGHVPARSGDGLLKRLADALDEHGQAYAATGVAAAWLLTRFAGFRIATLYLREDPTPQVLESISFREDLKGANTWLVIPNDEGVFQDTADRDGVRCVHPVQAYMDLKGHPERAAEAAAHLRRELLKWNVHA